MRKEVFCNICGNKKVSILIKPKIQNVKANKAFSAAGGIRGTQRIVKCQNCSLVYVSPRFKREEIEEGYTKASDHGHSSQISGRSKTFKNGIGLISKIYEKKGSLLDVGSANGVFVKVAKDFGWDSSGIELSWQLVKMGRNQGLKLYQGTLQTAKFKKESFDVITYWDVLEHVYDPKREIGLAYNLLKPGGLLLINFPDFGSLPARLAGQNWWFLLSVHLYYFTRQTLSKLAQQIGFKAVKFKRHWQYLELGYLSGMISLYSKPLSNMAQNLFDALHLSKVLIPYYAGQSTIIFKKDEK